MYQAVAYFNYANFEADPVTAISQIINQWRYNGQIIGREFGVTYHQDHFEARVSIPEQESLLPKWNNEWVNEAFQQAGEIGVEFAGFEIIGQDYQADETSRDEQPEFLMLYTTYLDSCSPIKSGNSLKPVPLYQLLQQNPPLAEAVIKWQESWQACDQLQMNGSVLEQTALAEISEYQSELSQQGMALARQIEQEVGVPVYYYLYRLGNDEQVEHHRTCPCCGRNWKLAKPLHEMFYFQCKPCHLVSNLSWALL